MIGTYLPGDSVLHRAPAGLKLVLLLVAGATAVLLDRPWQVGLALVLVVAGYRVAGFGWSAPGHQLRPLLWLLGCTVVFHLVVSGWRRAVVVVGTIVVLVLLAGLVTLTTRTTALVEVIVTGARPLRRVGVDPERLGLLLALGIRSVPVVVGLAHEVRDAQRARGLTASPRAFAVPLVVRSLRHADRLGEALVARGADD
ncbi:MAG: energy-coupling factor transporter transmembrane component T family protein [Propionibacteriaceae bacterium]